MNGFLGIDWGGTYVKAGLVNSRGTIIKKSVYSSKELKKKEVFIRNLEEFVAQFKKYNIKGIGIGAPGIIDVKKGFIYYLPNIPGWENYPLRSILRKKLRLPIFLDNDANLFALAESRCGAAQGVSQAIILTLGTGLGGACIVQGNILEARTSASEIGHVPIRLGGRRCGCGSRGCIETFVGAPYLMRRYQQLSRHRESLAGGVKELFQRGVAGEKEALVVWREFSQSLGTFLAGMVNVFNPRVIVFGGGIAGAYRLFKPLVWQAIKEHAMWPQLQGLRLVKARLKDAGIVGAALLVKEKCNSSPGLLQRGRT